MFQVNLKQIFNSEKISFDECELEPCKLVEQIPNIDVNYVFELKVLNEVLLYLFHPFKDCLYIAGPSGCGKTTLILQIAARLNWGVEQITLSNKCESLDLIGHTTLKQGQLIYEYGPLTRAMIYGEILILNEIDLMSPGDLAVLNDVLEGKPLTIVANNGEIIKPHPQFRVVATANTKGFGDMTGFYNGARLLNQAFLDRWRFIEMTYPNSRVELMMLKTAFPNLDTEMANKLIRFANELRKVVELGIDNGVRQISAPFSSRTLLKIASLVSVNTEYTVHKIVNMCYALRLPKIEQEYVMRLCNDVFGHEKAVLKKTQKNDLDENVNVESALSEEDDENKSKSDVKPKTQRRSRKTLKKDKKESNEKNDN